MLQAHGTEMFALFSSLPAIGKVIIKRDAPLEKSFLYYLLCTRQYRNEIMASATGTTVKHTSPTRILQFRFRRPPLDEQRAIAQILTTLDDKIDLNRRISETLESIAQALFKSWFLDFDPVRAQAEGRPRLQLIHIAGMFPDSFDESEFGECPRVGSSGILPEVIDVNPTRTLSRGEIAPYLDMANMPTRGHSPAAEVETAHLAQDAFLNGDTLVARITPCLENGKTAYVDFLKEDQVAWGSTEYMYFAQTTPA